MSYRIRLHVVKKKKFNKIYDPLCPNVTLTRLLKGKSGHELWDELNLDDYENIEGVYEEYHPRIGDKADFRSILRFYQKSLYEWEINKYRDEKFNKDNADTRSHFIEYYFEELIDSDNLITTSSSFLLDYFYLVSLYEKFDNNKHMFVITHG